MTCCQNYLLLLLLFNERNIIVIIICQFLFLSPEQLLDYLIFFPWPFQPRSSYFSNVVQAKAQTVIRHILFVFDFFVHEVHMLANLLCFVIQRISYIKLLYKYCSFLWKNIIGQVLGSCPSISVSIFNPRLLSCVDK